MLSNKLVIHFRYSRGVHDLPRVPNYPFPLEWNNGRKVSSLPGSMFLEVVRTSSRFDVIISDPALSRQVKLCGVHTLLKRTSEMHKQRPQERLFSSCAAGACGPSTPGVSCWNLQQSWPSRMVGRVLPPDSHNAGHGLNTPGPRAAAAAAGYG